MLTSLKHQGADSSLPFDNHLLDRLMDQAHIDVDHLRKLGLKPRRIGVEWPFLPADAAMLLQRSFPDSEIVDSLLVLERLRARKTPDELRKLRLATDTVVDSMLAVIERHGPGVTKQEMVDALRREETNRGLL